MDLSHRSIIIMALAVIVAFSTPLGASQIKRKTAVSEKLVNTGIFGETWEGEISPGARILSAAKATPRKTAASMNKGLDYAAETKESPSNPPSPAPPANAPSEPILQPVLPPSPDREPDAKPVAPVSDAQGENRVPKSPAEKTADVVPSPSSPPSPQPLLPKDRGRKPTAPVSDAQDETGVPKSSAEKGADVKPPLAPLPSSIPAANGGGPSQPLPLPGQPGVPPAPVPPPVIPEPIVAVPQIFNLNFDNADLNEVIDVIAKSLQLNYMVDPRVKGTVTIHTSGKLAKPELFSVMEQILKMNGVAIVKVGEIYKIMPFVDAQTEAGSPQMEQDSGEAKSRSGQDFVIQIIPLDFIPPAQMAKILKPFLTPGATIYEIPVANVLVISDMRANIQKLLKMVRIFDIQIFQNVKVELFSVQNTSAEEITTELESIFAAYGLLMKDKQSDTGVRFLPITRLNSVLAIASSNRLLTQASDWVTKLDQRAEMGTDVHVYFVENVKAEDLAAVLTQIYSSDAKKSGQKSAPGKIPEPRPLARPGQAPLAEPIGDLSGAVKIIPDKGSNALVILATLEDFKIISQTVKKLDVVPRQVLIDVTIAEVSLDNELQYGVGWSLQHNDINSSALGGTVQNRTALNENTLRSFAPIAGFGYRLVDSANNLRALLTLLASQSRLNILSSPNIIASNNQKASIKVGAEVPIVSSEYAPLAPSVVAGQAQEQPITSRTIQYRDTGVLLTVTPHINSARLITMEVNQEVSEAQTTTTGVSTSPTFLKRKAETSLVVHDGQTALIGGLIQERKEIMHSGIPFLKDIPVFGWLFGSKSTSVKRTELIVLLTPRVIIERQELDQVTREMRDRIGALKSIIESQVPDKPANNK